MPLGPINLDYFLDYQNIVNREGMNMLRNIHTGFELGYSLFTRDHDYGLLAGINEGYFVGGLFVDLFIARIEFVKYAVELGEYPG